MRPGRFSSNDTLRLPFLPPAFQGFAGLLRRMRAPIISLHKGTCIGSAAARRIIRTMDLQQQERRMKKLLAIILLAVGSANGPAVAAAPSGATMLMPGVYTTADISRRCQTYTGRRVTGGTMVDTSRQAVFIACVQKLYNAQYGGASVAAAPVEQGLATAPVEQGLVTAPVGLPRSDYGYNPDGYGCSTDEGFGRRGVCDTNAY